MRMSSTVDAVEHIIKKADALVRRFKTRSPVEIARDLNIIVKYGEFTELKGLYSYMYRNRFIVLNSRLEEIEQTITCAHELGHDQLHRHLARLGLMKDFQIYNATGTHEYEANLFAAQLLIAGDDFLDCAGRGYTYAQIASQLNVHEELAVLKAVILQRQGHKFNIPYVPKSTYLGGKGSLPHPGIIK